MIEYRPLRRQEVELVWSIDRREIIDNIYYLENGALVLKPEHYDMSDWPLGEAGKYTPILLESFDRSGWFHGVFDANRLVGVAILENQFIGRNRDQLQLKFLHVSRNYRSRGLGKQLFDLSVAEARRRGARQMYISATPSENTVMFYLNMGCRVTAEPDPELYALEPEDIHLEVDL